MKKLMFGLIFCALLTGCGVQTDEAYITITYTDTLEELWSHGPKEDYGKSNGRANWEEWDEVRHCRIYLMYPEWYKTEAYYHQILGHETRHCFEGNFHD